MKRKSNLFNSPQKKMKIDPPPDNNNKEKEKEIITNGTTFYMNKLDYISEKENKKCLSFEMLLHSKFNRKVVDPNLRRILITTFVYEDQVLLTLVSKNIPVLLVTGDAQLKKREEKKGYSGLLKHIIMPWPNNINFGCYHGKLLIIRFIKFVRVVISSANLMSSDWNALGQCIWFQDFPIINEISPDCQFKNDLIQYLKDSTVGEEDINSYIKNVDFSKANAFIVTSMPCLYIYNIIVQKQVIMVI